MNIEALTVIGVFTLVLGIVLMIPGLWWARRIAKTLPVHSSGRMRITPFGLFYNGIVVGLVTTVFCLGYLAELSSGKTLALIAVVAIVGGLGEMIANKLGFKTVSKDNDSNA